MKALALLNRAVTVFTGIVLGFMTCLVMLQVIFRYVLSLPFPESQELAIYAMVYVVTFGSSIAVYKKTHVSVTFIVSKFPRTLQFVIRLCMYAATAAFFLLLVKYGWDLSMRSMIQKSPSTGIPVGWIVMSLPVSSAISLLYVVAQCVEDIIGFRHPAAPEASSGA